MPTRPMRYDDLFELKTIGSLEVSPDGEALAFTVAVPDREDDTYHTNIWLYSRDNGTCSALTAGENDTAPRWSPDGRHIAFLSRRGGDDSKAQVFIIAVSGGEAWQVSEDLEGASEVAWCPEGNAIAVRAVDVVPEPGTADLREAMSLDDDDCAKDFTREQPESRLRVTDRLKYRFDGVGYLDDRRHHLYLLELDSVLDCTSPCPLEATPLTGGRFDVEGFSWHPDGERIAFITNRDDDADRTWRRDIWEVSTDDRELCRLVESEGSIWGLSWSPDGEYLAYIGEDHSHGHATQTDLWLYEDRSGETAGVTGEFDRAVGSQILGDVRSFTMGMAPVWSTDSSRVFFTAADQGDVYPFRAELDGLQEAEVDNLMPRSSGAIGCLGTGPDTLWFVREDPTKPGEIWELPLVDGENGEPLCRTGFNTRVMEEIHTQPYQRVHYRGPDGLPIEGFVCLPPDFDPERKYPLILYIHGGPHGTYGNVFSGEVQSRAAAGRVVLLTNPRGSGGYGQEFTSACVGDWGGLDYLDIMAGVDEIIDRGYVDTDRMAVTGISYGGFMTNWVITHTDRFAAAITEMCVSNLLSFYGTSDIGTHFLEFEIPGSIWDDPENLWEHSPIKYIANCTTPTLVIHGEDDWRCPIEQGEQVFACLKRRGVETAMIRFPGCSHVFSIIGKPSQRLQRFNAMEAWLERHI